MKKVALFLISIGYLPFSMLAAECQNPTIAAPPYWFQFVKTLENGEQSGRAIDMAIDVLSPDFGKPDILPLQPWARTVKQFREGKVDIMVGFLKNKEREKHYLYTMPWTHSSWGVITLKALKINWHNESSLLPYIGGYENGVKLPEPFLSYAKRNKSFVPFKDKQNMAEMLTSGRIDYIVDIDSSLRNISINHPHSAVHMIQESIVKAPLYMAISKSSDCAKFLNNINRALKAWITQKEKTN